MFIDSHAHLDGAEFDRDREQVIDRARNAEVDLVLNVGTGDPHSEAFERAIDFGKKYDHIYTAIGTHPHDARHYDDLAEQKTKDLISANSRIIAWGEIGLDFHYDNSPRDVQIEVFRRQLRCAQYLDLPVIIHTREAESETIDVLKSEYSGTKRRGIFHCFSGSLELAKAALDLGFIISFSGIITFKKADEVRAVAAYVPEDRILIETDCPFLSPSPYRGWRNEPAHVVEVARGLSECRGLELEEVGRITSDNFLKFFDLPAVVNM
ncbi:MAG TPA: TatD family hydrolase [Pyrinomonadaceae bacterium]|jgi:TatD DNase family protein